MTRLLIAAAVFLLALGANAALYFRNGAVEDEQPAGRVNVTLAGIRLSVPRALIHHPAHVAGGRLEALELGVAIADFTALPRAAATSQASAATLSARAPEKLIIALRPALGQSGPAEALQQLYARFLTGETLPRADGLVARRFQVGTPYEDRDLFIGAGANRLFIALCPRRIAGQQADEIEGCIARLRVDDIDVELRFASAFLPDWRRLSAESLKHLAQWRG